MAPKVEGQAVAVQFTPVSFKMPAKESPLNKDSVSGKLGGREQRVLDRANNVRDKYYAKLVAELNGKGNPARLGELKTGIEKLDDIIRKLDSTNYSDFSKDIYNLNLATLPKASQEKIKNAVDRMEKAFKSSQILGDTPPAQGTLKAPQGKGGVGLRRK